VGTATDGSRVIGGWFPLVNSEGIPLEVVLGFFRDRGLVPSWTSFIDEAIRCGWNLGSLRTKISSSTGDVYGPDHRDEVLKRFDIYIKRVRSSDG
jgi:hypothetical protein